MQGKIKKGKLGLGSSYPPLLVQVRRRLVVDPDRAHRHQAILESLRILQQQRGRRRFGVRFGDNQGSDPGPGRPTRGVIVCRHGWCPGHRGGDDGIIGGNCEGR